jgi:hypothetical protein
MNQTAAKQNSFAALHFRLKTFFRFHACVAIFGHPRVIIGTSELPLYHCRRIATVLLFVAESRARGFHCKEAP